MLRMGFIYHMDKLVHIKNLLHSVGTCEIFCDPPEAHGLEPFFTRIIADK